MNEYKQLMEKSVQHFTDQILAIRSGAITAAVVEVVKVPYYGQPTPISHLATTDVRDGRIAVTPYDPTVLGAVDKALKEAGFNSYVFSKTTVVVNQSTIANARDREKVVSLVKKLAEEAKVAIRNLRKKGKQQAGGTEDEQKRQEQQLQTWTDQYVNEVTAVAERKIQQL